LTKKNVALYRGSPTDLGDFLKPGHFWYNATREALVKYVIDNNLTNIIDAGVTFWTRVNLNDPFAVEIRNKFGIPLQYCKPNMDVKESTKYKYVIMIDGSSVRDGFPQNVGTSNVILKQKSKLREFWYYDLVNNVHLIEWTSVPHLISIVKNITSHVANKDTKMVQFLYNISLNGQAFVENYLTDEKSYDCFILHMLHIYTKYFYGKFPNEEESNKRDSQLIRITPQSLSKYEREETSKTVPCPLTGVVYKGQSLNE